MSEIGICLRLLPDNPLPLEAVTGFAAYVRVHKKFPPNVKNPWGAAWTVFNFMYPEQETLQGGPITEIVTVISLKTNKVAPKKFFNRLKKILSTEWYLGYNGTVFRLKQSIMPYCKFEFVTASDSLVRPFWSFLLEQFNLSSPRIFEFDNIYRLADTFMIEPFALQITELLLCEQFELYPPQIEVYKSPGVWYELIFYKDRIYFPDEFLKVDGRGRRQENYRICAVSNGNGVSVSTTMFHSFSNKAIVIVLIWIFNMLILK